MTPLEHRLHIGSSQSHAAPDVDVEHPLPVFIGGLEKVTECVRAEVVYEDVDLRVGRSCDFLIAGNAKIRRKRQRTIAIELFVYLVRPPLDSLPRHRAR